MGSKGSSDSKDQGKDQPREHPNVSHPTTGKGAAERADDSAVRVNLKQGKP